MAGVNDAGGSRTTSLGRGGGHQQFFASGASTRAPEHEKDTTSEGLPFSSFKLMFTIPIITTTLDIALAAAEAFRYLKTVLGFVSIAYETCEVRLRPPLKLLSNESTYRKQLP